MACRLFVTKPSFELSDSLLIGNEVQWNLNNNKTISMQENEFENVMYKNRPLCFGLNVSKYS